MRRSRNSSAAPKLPDADGHFGPYGGRYVAETLMPAILDLEKAWAKLSRDARFRREFQELLVGYAGRPTRLHFARRLTERLGGAKVYLKREDLLHTGAHKINNTIGQALVARRLKKRRLIAETGAGQHGVATATVAALFGMPCEIFMGAEDVQRQSLNVFRMKLLGAEVRVVESGARTLKDAMNEALRDWIATVTDTFYVIGKLPTAAIACIGGGSNAMGLFHAFRNDRVELIGVEAAGLGLETGKHAASLNAGLDYPGVGPEHAWLRDSGRATYVTATDDEAVDALRLLAETEGIIPA